MINVFVNQSSEKGPIAKIYKAPIKLNKEKENKKKKIQKWGEDVNRNLLR